MSRHAHVRFAVSSDNVRVADLSGHPDLPDDLYGSSDVSGLAHMRGGGHVRSGDHMRRFTYVCSGRDMPRIRNLRGDLSGDDDLWNGNM